MRVLIKRIRTVYDDEVVFMKVLETLSSNKEKRAKNIISLDRSGIYKSHISISGKNHAFIYSRLKRLIDRRVILEGDILITRDSGYVNYFSVIKGSIINSI